MSLKETTHNLLISTLACVGVMLTFSFYAYFALPEDATVPTHWNARGEVDANADKGWGLFTMPAIMLATALLLSFLPRFHPRKENMQLSRKTYTIITATLFLFMTVLHAVVTLNALSHEINIINVAFIGISILFVIWGKLMGNMKRNFFMGLRNPWTLSSELSWNKTHRLTGKLFIALGVIMMTVCLTSDPFYLPWSLIGGLGIVLAIAFPYSYVIYKNDPEQSAQNE